jgi:hypothetical protein
MKFSKDLLDSVTGIMKNSASKANEERAQVADKMTNKYYSSMKPADEATTEMNAHSARAADRRIGAAIAGVYAESLRKEAIDRQARNEYMEKQYAKIGATRPDELKEDVQQIDELVPALGLAARVAAGVAGAAAAGTAGKMAADKMMQPPKKKDVFTTKNGVNYKNGKAIGPVSDPDGGSATNEGTVTSVADVKAPIAKPQESGTVNKVADERMKKQKVGLAKEELEADTPVETQGKHQCAIHVKHSQFGEGRTLTSQHAEPNAEGLVEWYDVMFEHGIEKNVSIEDLEVLVSESHMNHGKKKK